MEYLDYNNSESDSESFISSDGEYQNQDNKPLIKKKLNIMVDTLDRGWNILNNSCFNFSIKFSPSSNQNYNDIILSGTQTCSIPINIKNIKRIFLDKIIVPNKNIYMGNGDFYFIGNLNYINVIIDEIPNHINGSNNDLNKSTAVMISDSSPTDGKSFLEYKNIDQDGIEFKPSLLNGLNNLNINLLDSGGNLLKFKDEILIPQSIEIHNNIYLKITTTTYFSKNDFQENDTIYFKDIESNNIEIKLFLERKQGHRIIHNENQSQLENISIHNLHNEFYIMNKGEYDGNTFKESFTSINIISNKGKIANRNLQILYYFVIDIMEMDTNIFNSQII